LARLKVEALGPHAVVERGERDELLFARLHDGERRPHASGGIAAEQVAAAEGIAPQDLVVLGVERVRSAARELAAWHAAQHGRDRLDRLIHLRGDVPQHGVAFGAEPRADAAGRALLAPRPHQAGRGDLEARVRLRGRHLARVERVRVLAREHEEPESQAGELHRRLGKIKAELLKGAAARRHEHVARGRERKNLRGSHPGLSTDPGADPGRKPGVHTRCRQRAGAGRAHGLQPVATGEWVDHVLKDGDEGVSLTWAPGRVVWPSDPLQGALVTGWDWLIILLYFALLLGLAWWVARRNKDTADDYFLAGRNLIGRAHV